METEKRRKGDKYTTLSRKKGGVPLFFAFRSPISLIILALHASEEHDLVSFWYLKALFFVLDSFTFPG